MNSPLIESIPYEPTNTRPPNRVERRAVASKARKAKPAKVRGKKITKRKVSTSA